MWSAPAHEATPDFEDHPDPVGRQQRLADPILPGTTRAFQEIAPFIALLVSPAASYATGGVFVIDGGLTVR